MQHLIRVYGDQQCYLQDIYSLLAQVHTRTSSASISGLYGSIPHFLNPLVNFANCCRLIPFQLQQVANVFLGNSLPWMPSEPGIVGSMGQGCRHNIIPMPNFYSFSSTCRSLEWDGYLILVEIILVVCTYWCDQGTLRARASYAENLTFTQRTHSVSGLKIVAVLFCL